MIDFVEKHRQAIDRLCRLHDVERLTLFGSANDGSFDPARSDVDFLVSLRTADAIAHKRSYVGLKESLSDLLGCKVDLLTERSIVNRRFRESIEANKTLLYAA